MCTTDSQNVQCAPALSAQDRRFRNLVSHTALSISHATKVASHTPKFGSHTAQVRVSHAGFCVSHGAGRVSHDEVRVPNDVNSLTYGARAPNPRGSAWSLTLGARAVLLDGDDRGFPKDLLTSVSLAVEGEELEPQDIVTPRHAWAEPRCAFRAAPDARSGN